MLKPNVPQILINREPLSHMNFDVELYGNCDDVIAELCLQLGSEWTDVLQGFTPSTLDNERWKMFYDYCESSDSGNEEDQTQRSILSTSEEATSGDTDNNCNSHNESSKQCRCGEGPGDNEDDGIEVGEKRKVKCSCTKKNMSEEGPSPNKRIKANIHTDQGKIIKGVLS